MLAMLLAAPADSSDTTRHLRVPSPRQLRRAVLPPRLVAQLSDAVADIGRRNAAGALEEGSKHGEADGPATSQAVVVQRPGVASHRLLVASLLCLFFGGF